MNRLDEICYPFMNEDGTGSYLACQINLSR